MRCECSRPFLPESFLGYVNEVTPQRISIHFPEAKLLERFRCDGIVYSGGNVGEFVLIEGERYGFLAKVFNLKLPDSERKELSEKAIKEASSSFHPIAEAELLLSFSIQNPSKIEKTISRFPEIGAKVYASSASFFSQFVARFGSNGKDDVFIEMGASVSNDARCEISLNSLIGRHCAVVGTTGSGKSWTVAKIVEALLYNTKNQVILVDPTGEYAALSQHRKGCKCGVVGEDCYFPYEKLRISDLICLLRPTGQVQKPILIEAIRSLKTVKLADKLKDETFKAQRDNGCLVKQNRPKKAILNFQFKHEAELEDEACDFDVNNLVRQIKNECVWPNAQDNIELWGAEDRRSYDFQSSLIFRIKALIASKEFNNLFNFSHVIEGTQDITDVLDTFLRKRQSGLLRLDFSGVSSSFNAREVVANSLARYLYTLSKKKRFIRRPVLFVFDEAHLFLNKNLIDADQTLMPLNSVDLIAKECRKFGLFLCLATQMPRDIPVGTLSQMGSFVVHRLINEQDRRTIEMACSVATKSAMAYLPSLGAGEAVVMGVDFQMAIPLKIQPPAMPPDSETPRISARDCENNGTMKYGR